MILKNWLEFIEILGSFVLLKTLTTLFKLDIAYSLIKEPMSPLLSIV
jgi:hypothetical protein